MPANMPMVLPPNQSSWRSVEMKLLTRLRGPCRIDPAAEAPDLNKDSRVVSRAKCIEDAIFIIVVVVGGVGCARWFTSMATTNRVCHVRLVTEMLAFRVNK